MQCRGMAATPNPGLPGSKHCTHPAGRAGLGQGVSRWQCLLRASPGLCLHPGVLLQDWEQPQLWLVQRCHPMEVGESGCKAVAVTEDLCLAMPLKHIMYARFNRYSE